MFIAIAIGKLIENGKINLNDKIVKHLPDFPLTNFANEVTIDQLLKHTSGLGDYWDEEYEANWDNIRELKEKVKYITNDIIETYG